ncbi:uncharacterized protein PpBr36_09956 [Pyricularia pennisetigena]|uniref:uncharacterized protein n=1 Tax=Pyricularia pennisetigena TaxID=1578925 RepID=UPI00115245F2|nr:uncharacterized protein PpBr36_09956 [Pyricularia pennisetigena]TLS22540.1 hypothetical protein PpBr36_09956 [Pyricularia pennisetigena]
MYIRPFYAETHTPALQAFIRDHPLGILITALPDAGIQLTHIPWVLQGTSETELGVLRGHMARSNPHAKTLSAAAGTSGGVVESEATVLFDGSPDHYVTAGFYTATKPTTGKVVPTWNYSAVRGYGKVRVLYDHADPTTNDFLQRQVEDLTAHCEGHVMGYDEQKQWRVGDAPDRYIDVMKKSIVGVELVLERLEGKVKMSQEMGLGDRKGVVEGFRALGTEAAKGVADLVEAKSLERERARGKGKVDEE